MFTSGGMLRRVTERKPPGVSIESWVEMQIREAQERGEFDDLPGRGQPLKGIDGPHDDMWWIKQWLKREGLSFTPPTLALRKSVEDTLGGIGRLRSEKAVRDVAEELNERIRQMNRMPPADGPPTSLGVIDVERLVESWRAQRAAIESTAGADTNLTARTAPSAESAVKKGLGPVARASRAGRKARVERVGGWSSDEAEARFRAGEEALWREECTIAPEALDVETSAGSTRVYRWPGAGESLVLLHGMGGAAIQWVRVVRELVSRDVYAIDTMGDVGRSRPKQAFRDHAQVDEWLSETLAALGLERVHLVGHDHGAYLAMRRAIASSNRVITLTLLDPSGFAERSARMVGRLVTSVAVILLPGPARRWAATRIGMPLLAHKLLGRLTFLALRHHRYGLPMPRAVRDDELASLSVPTLVLVGAKTVMFEPDGFVRRVRAQVPCVEADVVPGVAYAILADAATGARIRQFACP